MEAAGTDTPGAPGLDAELAFCLVSPAVSI